MGRILDSSPMVSHHFVCTGFVLYADKTARG